MFGIPSPYIFGGLLLIGFISGYKVKDWQCDAAYAKALEQSDKQRKQMQETINAISTSYEEERDKANVMVSGTRETIREIYKTLPPVRSDCSLDVRSVGMLQSSIDSANAAAAGKSGK